MPKPYPQEFREDVIRVARNREPDVLLRDIANDFGISESCLANWLKAANVEDGYAIAAFERCPTPAGRTGICSPQSHHVEIR